jgi:hypothetical protein
MIHSYVKSKKVEPIEAENKMVICRGQVGEWGWREMFIKEYNISVRRNDFKKFIVLRCLTN